jgi:hypothetical protein
MNADLNPMRRNASTSSRATVCPLATVRISAAHPHPTWGFVQMGEDTTLVATL